MVYTLYYSNSVKTKRLTQTIINTIQKYPAIRQQFKIFCIDDYVRKYNQMPNGIRKVPTVLANMRGQTVGFEGQNIIDLLKKIASQIKSQSRKNASAGHYPIAERDIDAVKPHERFVDNTRQDFDDVDYTHDRRQNDQLPPGAAFGRGASMAALVNPPKQAEPWHNANGASGNRDPSQFAESMDSKSSKNVESDLKRYQMGREMDDKRFSSLLEKRKGQGPGPRNRTMKV